MRFTFSIHTIISLFHFDCGLRMRAEVCHFISMTVSQRTIFIYDCLYFDREAVIETLEKDETFNEVSLSTARSIARQSLRDL